MNFLIIDGSQNKINFFSIYNNNSYHKIIKASKNNNEKFALELFNFFKENKINVKKLNNIFVNQGPGKFSGIRTSISVAKALLVSNKLNLYGFSTMDIKGNKYENIINLYKKGALTKNLINAIYSS